MIGLKIKEIKENPYIKNDYGTELGISTHSGCGDCCSGWSELPNLRELIKFNHIITNVEIETDSYNEDKFKIFVYYHDECFDGFGNDGWDMG